MQNIRFHVQNTASQVDQANSVIRDVSLITGGIVAEGHDLHVDATTLTQILLAAQKAGQVPVKLNHGSGVENVCGYLDNFRLSDEGNKVLGDWHLLKSHEETPMMLERAERMPGCFGLSVAFKGKGVEIGGKKVARCEELKAVDCVASPAANPDGLFSSREFADPRPRNQLGQFDGGVTGSADPQAMARAYGGVAERKQGRLARIAAALRRGQLVIPANEPALTSRRRLIALGLPTAHEAAVARVEKNSTATAAAAEQRIKRQQLADKFIRQQKASEQQKAEKSALDEFYKTNTFATPEPTAKRRLNPYLGAAISGGLSGAALGAASFLRRGVSLRSALKSAGAMGAASAGIVGGGAMAGSRILNDDDTSDEQAPFLKRAALGGATTGIAAGLASTLVLKKVPFARRALTQAAKTWRPANALLKAGPVKATLIGGTVGGLYGGAQGADEGAQVDMINALRSDRKRAKSKRLASAAKLHHFAAPFVQDEAGVPLTGKIARDRFVKRLRDEDLDRRDANLGRAALAGAATGMLMPGALTKAGLLKRAAIGTGAGLASVMGIRAATTRTRDVYGERPRTAKQAEKFLPLTAAAAIAAAGIKKRLTGKFFSSQVRDALRLADRLENLKTL